MIRSDRRNLLMAGSLTGISVFSFRPASDVHPSASEINVSRHFRATVPHFSLYILAGGHHPGRRLFIPNPIAMQLIAWKSLVGCGLRSSQPGGSAFPYASYATKRIAL